MKKRLYRIRDGKIIAGVCGGIAKYIDVKPKVIRILWLVFLHYTEAGLWPIFCLQFLYRKSHKTLWIELCSFL
ncbi:PspC domain-containing protein [Oscillibacter sp.]|uniref:PspC domain-containing protein n=1 Tax=Oscillibacter sp. TaxID=1945593 RepID=UPI00289933AB|nr:PspC domain-containing protein [Oscillibacter sp.]